MLERVPVMGRKKPMLAPTEVLSSILEKPTDIERDFSRQSERRASRAVGDWILYVATGGRLPCCRPVAAVICIR
ncbi:hypothetical protein OKW49_002559 [Paraburkholderia youngii]